MNTKERIFQIVEKIPSGKVITYGQLARLADSAPRAVGTYLHQNKNPERYPCHRVVHSDGRLAPSYVFGGSEKQFQKLKKEKVSLIGKKVNLRESFWTPT